MKAERSRSERAVLEEQPPQDFPIDRYIAERLGDDRRQEHGLSRKEVHLPEEPGAAVTDYLPA